MILLMIPVTFVMGFLCGAMTIILISNAIARSKDDDTDE
jgi:hypothetical protein